MRIIENAFKKVREIPREQALKKVEKKSSERPVLAIQYHPALPSVANVVNRHWQVMTESREMKSIFPQPSMIAYKRGKNLGEHLFRAKVSSKRRSTRDRKGFKACQQGCRMCWHCKKTNTWSHVTITWSLSDKIFTGVLSKLRFSIRQTPFMLMTRSYKCFYE